MCLVNHCASCTCNGDPPIYTNISLPVPGNLKESSDSTLYIFVVDEKMILKSIIIITLLCL